MPSLPQLPRFNVGYGGGYGRRIKNPWLFGAGTALQILAETLAGRAAAQEQRRDEEREEQRRREEELAGQESAFANLIFRAQSPEQLDFLEQERQFTFAEPEIQQFQVGEGPAMLANVAPGMEEQRAGERTRQRIETQRGPLQEQADEAQVAEARRNLGTVLSLMESGMPVEQAMELFGKGELPETTPEIAAGVTKRERAEEEEQRVEEKAGEQEARAAFLAQLSGDPAAAFEARFGKPSTEEAQQLEEIAQRTRVTQQIEERQRFGELLEDVENDRIKTLDTFQQQLGRALTNAEAASFERARQVAMAEAQGPEPPDVQDIRNVKTDARQRVTLLQGRGENVRDPLTEQEIENPADAADQVGRALWIERYPDFPLPGELVNKSVTDDFISRVQNADAQTLKLIVQQLQQLEDVYRLAGVDLNKVRAAIAMRKETAGFRFFDIQPFLQAERPELPPSPVDIKKRRSGG